MATSGGYARIYATPGALEPRQRRTVVPTLNEAVDDFLAQRRIAVAGVSRNRREAANYVYRKLRDVGYQVFPINPAAREVEGDACYPDLKSIPGGVDGVVIATRPVVTDQIVRDCAEAGVPAEEVFQRQP